VSEKSENNIDFLLSGLLYSLFPQTICVDPRMRYYLVIMLSDYLIVASACTNRISCFIVPSLTSGFEYVELGYNNEFVLPHPGVLSSSGVVICADRSSDTLSDT
jgi:hypothetical protein